MNVCGALYASDDGTTYACQFPADTCASDDPLIHSWAAIKVADEDERRAKGKPWTSSDALDLAATIVAGEWDEWIELLLNALHGRKHELRGRRGFSTADRLSVIEPRAGKFSRR